MAAQLKALTELVQQLQADNRKLREEVTQRQAPPTDSGASSGQSSSSSTVHNDDRRPGPPVLERYVYIPRDRKCPRFSGKLSHDSLTVEEWVEEARRHLSLRPMPLSEQTLNIFDLLDGEAKAEVKFRPTSACDSPEKIFEILKSMYGCTQSYISLQKAFFQRRQLESESLREYSHALMHMLEAVNLRDPACFANPDIVLRDFSREFIENVRDVMLKRELGRQVRSQPSIVFYDIRSEAFRWVQEGEHTSQRPRAHSFSTHAAPAYDVDSNAVSAKPTNELTELKESLRKQQAQLDTILKRLDSSQLAAPSSLGPQSRPRLRFQADGTPICAHCSQPGHIARFCRSRSSTGPRIEVASHAQTQQQEN